MTWGTGRENVSLPCEVIEVQTTLAETPVCVPHSHVTEYFSQNLLPGAGYAGGEPHHSTEFTTD